MPEECQYLLQDDLGSPIRLLDQDGEIKESYGYDEFGQMRYQEQPPASHFPLLGISGTRKRAAILPRHGIINQR